MGTKKSQEIAKRVFHYYENCSNFSKIKTVHHFSVEGIPRSTIYRIISRVEQTKQVNNKKSTGRPAIHSTPKQIKKVETLFKRNPTISVRKAAQKLQMNRSTLSDIKSKKLKIKGYTRKPFPKHINNQEARAKTGLRKIYEKARRKVLVIDDESYVIANPAETPGRKFFHAKNLKEGKFEAKFKPKTSFSKN